MIFQMEFMYDYEGNFTFSINDFVTSLNASVFVDPYRQDVKYSQIKLGNGINVIIQQDPLTMADVVFVVNAGSALDGKHQGLAHLLEHMMFQGSKSTPV